MFVKLDNKFHGKYDMWVETSELETLIDIPLLLSKNVTKAVKSPCRNLQQEIPNYAKKTIVVYCHEPNDQFGIKFRLYGVYTLIPNEIKYTTWERIS